MPIPIISIIGKSNSGKTTLLEKLIRELKQRGYRVATIKHHSHAGFEVDQPGKDTWRHAQAGSDLVIIAAPDKIAVVRKLEQELSLDEVAAGIEGVDIILTEGYKSAGKPAIEVLRSARGTELVGDPGQIMAIACDLPASEFPQAVKVPVFDLDDFQAITDFIIMKIAAS
jgi:molybdopterin-guanine dinucleotide biosynthesis protein B